MKGLINVHLVELCQEFGTKFEEHEHKSGACSSTFHNSRLHFYYQRLMMQRETRHSSIFLCPQTGFPPGVQMQPAASHYPGP